MVATQAVSLPFGTPPYIAFNIPPDVNVLSGILEHYGFDHFFKRTLRMINLDNTDYSDAVDEALERFRPEPNSFSLNRAFRDIVEELKEDEGYTTMEALEFLSEEDYVVPVTTVMEYSVHAGDADAEFLSRLIRRRAKTLLRQFSTQAD
jgi:hypothetical protein